MILLRNLHVQEPIHAIHVSLSCVNFFWKEVDRCYIWPTTNLSGVSSMTAKNNHAMSRHAKYCGHLRISRRLNEQIKLGGVPIKIVLQKFLFCSYPVIQIKAMRVPTPFEKLVGTLGDCCQNDFLVLVVSAFDRNHPVVATTLSGLLLHSRTSFCIHPSHPFPQKFCSAVPDRECHNFGSRRADNAYRFVGWLRRCFNIAGSLGPYGRNGSF